MEQGEINLITKDHISYSKTSDGQIDIRFKIYPINNIIVRIATSEDLMSLMIVADKIKKANCVINYIYVTYLTSHNLDIIASMINSINYRTIYINDPVWRVPYIIEKCCLENALSHLNYGNKNIAIVYLNQQEQDLYGVGNSYIYEPNMEIKEKTIRIVSRCNLYRICDIAREFKSQGKRVELAVSYIINEKLDNLLESFDKIYTTNGYSDIKDSDKLEVFKLRS